MAIINTIGNGGIQLTPLMPLLLNYACIPPNMWADYPINDSNVDTQGYQPTLKINNSDVNDAYLDCYLYAYNSSGGTYFFVPLVDFSFDVYQTDSYMPVTSSSISIYKTFTCKIGIPYEISIGGLVYGHGQMTFKYYNGSTWVTIESFGATSANASTPYMVCKTRDYVSGVERWTNWTFKAHILSPLVFKQPNYNL